MDVVDVVDVERDAGVGVAAAAAVANHAEADVTPPNRQPRRP